MSLINIKRLFLAVLTKDIKGTGTGNLTFATPEYIPGIQKIDVKLKTDTAKNFEEGVLTDQDTTLTDIEIDFDLGHLSNAQYAKYLGHTVATEGGVFSKDGDVAPYIAILIEYEKNEGILGYKVLYKGRLTEPDFSVKQKEGKIDYQNHTVTATFQPLNNNGLWQYCVEQDDPDCPENISTAFFESVIIPTPKAA